MLGTSYLLSWYDFANMSLTELILAGQDYKGLICTDAAFNDTAFVCANRLTQLSSTRIGGSEPKPSFNENECYQRLNPGALACPTSNNETQKCNKIFSGISRDGFEGCKQYCTALKCCLSADQCQMSADIGKTCAENFGHTCDVDLNAKIKDCNEFYSGHPHSNGLDEESNIQTCSDICKAQACCSNHFPPNNEDDNEIAAPKYLKCTKNNRVELNGMH